MQDGGEGVSEPMTLANFDVPIPLWCFHCDKRLPKFAKVRLGKDGVKALIECPKCGLESLFLLEQSA